MKKDFLPYLLPIISIILVFGIVFFNPSTTGFVVQQNKDKIDGKIMIYTDDQFVLPLDSTINISIDNQTASMTIQEFIKKNNTWFEIKTGHNNLAEYYGQGYSGNHAYSLDLSEFGLGFINQKDIHNLKVRIYHKEKILSETNESLIK